ncbi:MAG: hypothetical protein HFF24_01550 [Oscillospiraceae bacterium]|nr:hypothetical protein [Oscillospiraceae bacterium]
MKRFLTRCLIVPALLLALCSCGGEEKIDYDLVFVNGSDAKIVEVVVDFQDRNGGSRNADSSPLKRGDSFGFEAGEYPVTVYVYDKVANDVVAGAVAQITVPKAPPEGERWYVTAWDGAGGLALTVENQWPEGV